MEDESEEQVLQQFGSALRLRRLELHLSQEKLAELAGIHRTYVSDIERGNRNVSLINIQKLLKALTISLPEFFQSYFVRAGFENRYGPQTVESNETR